jgi:hypothetical protein
VSVVGGVAFGVGRLTLREIRQTTKFQDSQNALLAAEAGIEDGLLRFRFSRDAQVPFNLTGTPAAQRCSTADEPTKDTELVLRVNLSTTDASERARCVNPKLVGAPDPHDIVYDLKIYFKATSLGDFSNPASAVTNPSIKKDGTFEIAGITPAVSRLVFKDDVVRETPNAAGFREEIRYLNESGQQVGDTQIVSGRKAQDIDHSGLRVDLPSGSAKLRFKSFAGETTFVAIDQVGTPIDFGFTYVVSIGYFNGVKRKLETAINRQNGTIHGVYDYVLFGGTSGIGQ